MKLSAFSFIHNAIAGGYPLIEAIKTVQPYVDEVVIVDLQSTDGTTELLQQLDVRIIPGAWGQQAGETLAQAHALHRACAHDLVIHFEADEVYDESLLWEIRNLLEQGITDLAVYRLQVSQNFQRIRWYPEPVHRIFPKGSVIKQGHTTNRHSDAVVIDPAHGFLWDCTNCFLENWEQRLNQQTELWGNTRYIMVPQHALHPVELSRDEALEQIKIASTLEESHWKWTETPLNIPEILRPLVGITKYNP